MVTAMVQSLTKTSVVTHLGWHNQTAQYRPGSVWLQRIAVLTCWRRPGRQICQLWVATAAMAYGKLGFIHGGIPGRGRDKSIPLYSALVRLHLERCAWLWSLQFKKDTDWRGFKGGPWKWPKGWRTCPIRRHWKNRGFFPWSREGLEEDFIHGISVLKGQLQRGQRLPFHKEPPGEDTGK